MTLNVSPQRDQGHLRYIISGIAGGFGGCVAKTVVAPLDRVKILFQASNPEYQKYAGSWTGAYNAGKDIYQQSGIRGLFQGHSATLLRIYPYAAIKYMAYDRVKDGLMPTRESQTNFKRFIAGSIAGSISVLFTYPLELIRVRLAFQTKSRMNGGVSNGQHLRPSLFKVVSDVYREGALSKTHNIPSPRDTTHSHLFSRLPILSFYRGFSVTMLGISIYAGTGFLTWEYLRSVFLPAPPPSHLITQTTPQHKQKSTPVADLSIGALSGAISQTVSYPFEVVRRRMQVGGLTRPDQWLGVRETVLRVWTTSGWRGFFVGLGIGYLKVVPMTATSFAVWQWTKHFLSN